MSLTPDTPHQSGAPGLIIGGCRLAEEIGRGGSGTVYRGIQLGIDRPVAVKLVPVTLGDARTIARFEREARIAGSLEHPNCLPVYAAGEEHGLLYLVMRLVRGSDLSALVRSQGSLPVEEAVQVIEQVAGALDAAHRAGLVHRDLKPSNVLLDRDRDGLHAYLADFGLMRAVADPDPVTESGQWVGTPRYAAPEQLRGEPIGPAADIYALGEVLQVLLSSLARESRAMRAVIARATADDPAERYRTAGELAAAARAAIADGRPRRAGGRRRRRGLGIGVAAVVVLAAASGAVAALLGDRRAASTGSHTTPVTTRPRPRPPLAADVPVRFTVPAGWVTTQDNVPVGNYYRTRLQGPAGAYAEVDRTPGAKGTLLADAQAVQGATEAKTPGYVPISSIPATVGGPAIVWAFSEPGPNPQRVDIFRRIGDQSYGVLAATTSQAESRRIATSIASSLQRG